MPPVGLYLSLCCAVAWLAIAHADERFATRQDAEALVAHAVSAIQTDKLTALREITAKERKWVVGDLYPMVYDMQGKCLAHGQNERQVGKLLIDLSDADGKPFIRQRIARANSTNRFWQDYKFTDPVSKKVLPKSVYCERTGELIVCAGIYLR